MLNFSRAWKDFRTWWDTPLGRLFLASEGQLIQKLMATCFGYHLLVLGEPASLRCVGDSPIRHRIWVHPHVNLSAHLPDASPLIARQDKLPFISDGIDVAYLSHCLEFINNPHEVLRETFRVLIPEGRVVIANFNPWSLWGLWRFVVRLIKREPWDGRAISAARLQDWLSLLGFEVTDLYTHYFCPPMTNTKFLQHFQWLEGLGRVCMPLLGGGYVLVARKRVFTLTPIRPKLSTKQILGIQGVLEPMPSE